MISYWDGKVIFDRFQYFVDQCKDRRVLDVGCIGDFPVDSWYFNEVVEEAEYVLGADINANEVVVRCGLGYNLVDLDISREADVSEYGKFNLIILGELIEHISSLDVFFRNLDRLLDVEGEIVLSTPNASSLAFIGSSLLRWRRVLDESHVMVHSIETRARLGSTRLKTNSTGDVIYESNYEPFGPEYGESGEETYRYTGKPEDSTGLYYYGARYYDPITGRFISRDTVFGELENPQTLNKYSYCQNNPIKYTDPDGKYAEVVIFGMVGFGAVFSINKMYQYSISYEKGSGDYHKGLITAGVSGFAKGSIYGLGKSVLTLTSVITALNPVFVTGALIFDSLAYTASNFLEVGVEEACYEILDYNNEDKNEVKERRRDSLTKAFIKSKNASGFKILENISPFSFDAFAQRSLNELEYQQYIRNKINSRVDHTTNWLENDRKNSQ